MIKGAHCMFYTSEPDALRDFMQNKMGVPAKDIGGGWLIFKLAEADMGVHPTSGQPATGTHDISFYCDDIEKTVADMKARGVSFASEIETQRWGKVIKLTMPGDVKVQIYQPLYDKG